jgi:hypothetical protein
MWDKRYVWCGLNIYSVKNIAPNKCNYQIKSIPSQHLKKQTKTSNNIACKTKGFFKNESSKWDSPKKYRDK